MKVSFYVTMSFLLACTLAPVASAGEKQMQSHASTKQQIEPQPVHSETKATEPAKEARPASRTSKTPPKAQPEFQKNRPPEQSKADIARPDGQRTPGAPTTLTPRTPATDSSELLGRHEMMNPGRPDDVPDPGFDDGLDAADAAVDALLDDAMDTMVFEPGKPGDEPGIGDNDPAEESGPGRGLDLIGVTGAVDPMEMGGRDTPTRDATELVDCVRGECDDGRVTASVAPEGSPRNPDGGWTDPARGGAGRGDPDEEDIDICARDPSCKTGTQGERQGESDNEACDDSDQDGRCDQYNPSPSPPYGDAWPQSMDMPHDPGGEDDGQTQQETAEADDSDDPPYKGPAPAD